MLKKSVSEEKQRGWPASKHVSTGTCIANQQILEQLGYMYIMYVMAKLQQFVEIESQLYHLLAE